MHFNLALMLSEKHISFSSFRWGFIFPMSQKICLKPMNMNEILAAGLKRISKRKNWPFQIKREMCSTAIKFWLHITLRFKCHQVFIMNAADIWAPSPLTPLLLREGPGLLSATHWTDAWNIPPELLSVSSTLILFSMLKENNKNILRWF